MYQASLARSLASLLARTEINFALEKLDHDAARRNGPETAELELEKGARCTRWGIFSGELRDEEE